LNYIIVVANGDSIIKRRIIGVSVLNFVDGAYVFRDTTGSVLFSAPYDSVVYVEQEL